MGWFDFWGERKSDPLGRLDPELKAFLERESPVRYHESSKPKVGSESKPKKGDGGQESPSLSTKDSYYAAHQRQQHQGGGTASAPTAAGAPPLPQQSLFQDGRYADLWKTYRPIQEVEADTKTDNEKLSDILDAYKERKRLIAKAAVENCSQEQFEWRRCMLEGGVRAKATLCRREVKAFESCYGAQSRLLKTLGYLQTFGRSLDLEEDIQVHAYDLYQIMLIQEKAIKAAREAGEPIPDFPQTLPVFLPHHDEQKPPEEEERTYLSSLPQDARERLQRRLEALGPAGSAARHHALRLWRDQYAEQQRLGRDVQAYWDEREREREMRVKSGKATLGDRAKGLWGLGQEDKGGSTGETEDKKL